MSTPRIITAGDKSSVTLSFTSLPSDAAVTVDLQDSKGASLDKGAKVIAARSSAIIENIAFSVPLSLENHTRLRITSTGGAIFDKVLPLEVRFLEEEIFIQTDKPIYKPGGTGRYHKFSVCLFILSLFLTTSFQRELENLKTCNTSLFGSMEFLIDFIHEFV